MNPEEKKAKMDKREQKDRVNVHVSGKQKALILNALDTINNEQQGERRISVCERISHGERVQGMKLGFLGHHRNRLISPCCGISASSSNPSLITRPVVDDDGGWFFPRQPLERNPQLDQRLLQDYQRMTESVDYQRTLSFRRKLPAFERRKKIMKLIESGNVCVISGATGSGKTTQIPQFILDEALEKGW